MEMDKLHDSNNQKDCRVCDICKAHLEQIRHIFM